MEIKLSVGVYNCNMHMGQYNNQRDAIWFTDADDGSPILTATVNIPEAVLGVDEILIKNWSENEGILECLIEHGIVEDTGRTVPCGYVQANVCKLRRYIP